MRYSSSVKSGWGARAPLRELIKYIEGRIEKLRKEIEALESLKNFMEEKLKSTPAPTDKDLPVILESVRWRRYREGRDEWCYADSLPSEFVEKLKEGPITIDGKTYIYGRLDRVEVVKRRPLKRDETP